MAKIEDPHIFVAMSYDTLFEDCNSIDPTVFLTNVSMFDALYFVAQRNNRINYSFSDVERQRILIYEMRCYFLDESDCIAKIDRFLLNNEFCYLFENESCFIYEMLVLQTADNSKEGLSNLDIKNIYKAYLYSCKIWLDKQAILLDKTSNIQEYSVRIDLPIVEFKTYKDFRTQLFKADQFFSFCEADNQFKDFLKYYLEDNQYKDYVDYLSCLFMLYYDSYDNLLIDDIDIYGVIGVNYKKYYISQAECKSIWDNKELLYLRNHFLFSSKKSLIIINPNLLVDKFYQGMIFDFWNSVSKHKGKSESGKVISNFADFKSIVGMKFSESVLFYNVISNSFPSEEYIKISGIELKSLYKRLNLLGEPDYYIRKDHHIFLFEFKDVTLSDSVKQSDNFKNIKNQVLARLCKDGDNNRKGAIQLLYNIDSLFKNEIDIEKDRMFSSLDIYFPILVTTDRCFDALGINSLIIQEFSSVIENKFNYLSGHVKMPIIINVDTLIDIMYRLRIGKIEFDTILLEYLSIFDNGLNTSISMMPFSSFVYDYYKMDSSLLKDDNQFLFGDLLMHFQKKELKRK